MKKRKLLYAVLILTVVVTLNACFRHHHDISISVNDDEDVYRMTAYYDEDRTWDVQRIINTRSQQHISLAASHGFIDTDVTLDDGSSFHVKSRPGRLKIRFDKAENSDESNERIREMCDEIKDMLAGK